MMVRIYLTYSNGFYMNIYLYKKQANHLFNIDVLISSHINSSPIVQYRHIYYEAVEIYVVRY